MPRKPKAKASTSDRRQDILAAARKHFAAAGLAGCNLRSIAHAAGVNMALISYYFGSKDGLYRACIESRAQNTLEISTRLLSAPRSRADFLLRLGLYIDARLEDFDQNPEAFRLVNRELDHAQSPAADIFDTQYIQAFRQLLEFLKAAQKEKLLRPHSDPLVLAVAFFALLNNLGRLDPYVQRFYKRSLVAAKERQHVREQILAWVESGLLA